MTFWTRNIGRGGRLLRGVAGAIFLLSAVWLSRQGFGWLALACAAAGAFALFEAARGWCVARACGLRTRW